jgi:hypothetical protein
MLRYVCLALIGLMMGSTLAMGSPVFLATQGRLLYRTEGTAIETFRLSDDITGMATAPDGTIWATSRSDDDHDGFRELYQLSDPLGPDPKLTFWGDFLQGLTPTLWVIGDSLYGYQKIAGHPLAEGQMIKIDYDLRGQMTVGATGAMGVPANGSGYDPVNHILYVIAGRPDGNLYSVDYGLSHGPDPTATLIGPLDARMRNGAAEFFDDTLYAAIQGPSGPLKLGWIDTTTGHFNKLLDLGPPSHRCIGLAILPEPHSFTLLGLGAAALLRRSRR